MNIYKKFTINLMYSIFFIFSHSNIMRPWVYFSVWDSWWKF